MPILARLARVTPNKGRLHVFLGSPLSDGCDKTTVEPGNTFSPGLWTCGISLWVEIGGQVCTPDLLPDEAVTWGFAREEDGGSPELVSRWTAGNRLRVLHRLTHLGTEGAEGVDFCAVTFTAEQDCEGAYFLVVRDIGPAGGKITSLDWDEAAQTLSVGGGPSLRLEQPPDEVQILPADTEFDSPCVLLRYSFALKAGQTQRLSFKTEHGFAGRQFAAEVPRRQPYNALPVDKGFLWSDQEWVAGMPTRIFCPDLRLSRLWTRAAFHLLSAMECGLPRIGAANYPVFWMRDGVLVLRALDFLGRHDLARDGCEYLAPLIFSGGFGAEADAPGEGIWALVHHARLTQDPDWLKGVFSDIIRRTDWLESMVSATETIRWVGENRTPASLATPGVNVVCLPAQNGLIHGRMDWHSPDFFVNCWAVAGFQQAALAAEMLGEFPLAARWRAAAERLDAALAAYLLPGYGNERDPAVCPHPTEALAGHRDALRDKLEAWFHAHRLSPTGERVPERLWTYFEVAQTHNALRLGLHDLAWANIRAMLGDGVPGWDVSAFSEGAPGASEFLPYGGGDGRRGWLNPQTALGGNMPHGWTAAEWIMLLRGIFIGEDGDTLLLGPGVPADWQVPGARFGARDMPTRWGRVSWAATVGADGAVTLDYDGPENYRTAWTKE